ncbi:MAG: hypothetical protein QOC65_1488 [Sphingomonadales bacterium]|nr:hypothetical protein [Sphingomonadales bacterium]
MIGLLLASLLLGEPADSSPSGWREFDRRQMGMGETAYLYNRWSVRGDHAVPTAWVTWDFHYSGRNSTTRVEEWQIDCARRRSRVVRGFTIDGEMTTALWRRGGGLRPFAPGSPEAALAARLCRPAPERP